MKTAALALLVPLLANAQAFRCTVDGAVAYQQRPCAGGVALALPRAEPARIGHQDRRLGHQRL